jgi:hypothetical protein
LTAKYGRRFSYAEFARMTQSTHLFPDEAIVAALSQQLSWSHVHALLPIKDPLAREFYAEMCRIKRWDERTIQCASADAEQVELLQLNARSIRASEYLTELPPLPLLRARLHQAIEHAREQTARRIPGTEEPP